MDFKKGLSEKEVKGRLEEFGLNKIEGKEKATPLKICLRQFKSFLIYILTCASILSFIANETTNGIIILFIIFFISFLGFLQEYRAEKDMAALKKMITSKALVLRDGKEQEIDSELIMPEDILILRCGDRVPADGVIFYHKDLKLEESLLTGESAPVNKNSIAPEKIHEAKDENKVFMGTFVVNGKCRIIVTHTGMNTEFGKIASMVQKIEKHIPLQKQIGQIAKYLTIFTIIVCVATFLVSLAKTEVITNQAILALLITAIALAVAGIPEGLPVVVTVALATSVRIMAKKNAIVNRMPAVETLGGTTFICCDKTGTLTKNEITVKEIYIDDKFYFISGEGYEGVGNIYYLDKKIKNSQELDDIHFMCKAAVLCNDSSIKTGETEYEVKGNPTEGALLVMAAKEGIFKEDLSENCPRIEEIPFSSDRKFMSTIHKKKDEHFLYCKGAPEVILGKCSYIYKNGRIMTLSKREKELIHMHNEMFTQHSLRTLAIAFKKVRKVEEYDPEIHEKNLVFIGLTGMMDPPRPDVQESIILCRRAGIKVMMITGDHVNTAVSVAREIGLLEPRSRVVTAEELDDLTDEELKNIVKDITVCARAKPEHKLRIVNALQARGERVAMTGDGVNDAPALKKADIGIALGSGNDVAKEASDIILKDNHFNTIVSAVKEGRNVFHNLQKFTTYLLSCTFSEIVLIFFGVLIFGPALIPLIALQILFLNLITDDLPAIALAKCPYSHDIMHVPPRDPKKGLLEKGFILWIIIIGSVIGFGTLTIFYFNLDQGIEKARTIALVTLVLYQLFNAFNFRSLRKPILRIDPVANEWLVYGVLVSLAAVLAVVYIPFLNKIFSTVPLQPYDWLISIVTGLTIFIVMDSLKLIKKFYFTKIVKQ